MGLNHDNLLNMDILDVIKRTVSTCETQFKIKGMIAFGSRVKRMATPDSDFDILIVAEGINPKRHRRGKEIMQIKRCLPPKPFDLLLFTPGEVISNFRNHNPLFLDIAEEGIILIDKDGLLQKLIKETREYIQRKEIKRLKDGWKFPIKHREVTYLSKVSNKDFAMAMLKDGERDYLISNTLVENGFFDKSVYHAQQSIEKCIKSILICFGIFQKSHFVGKFLLEVVNEQDIPHKWREKLSLVAELSEEIEPDVSLSRYPGIIDNNLWLPYEEYDKEDAENARKKAETVLSITKEFIRYWFPSP